MKTFLNISPEIENSMRTQVRSSMLTFQVQQMYMYVCSYGTYFWISLKEGSDKYNAKWGKVCFK